MEIIITIILIFLIADVLIVGYIIFKRSKKKLSQKLIEEIQAEWRKIIRLKDHRHGILEADKLLDHALTQMGYVGSLGAKLKKNPRLFKKINDVWAAHKIRNNIAHKINYEIDEKTYKKAMLQFKEAFKDLNIF